MLLPRQLHRGRDVQNDRGDQSEAHDPERVAHGAVQKMRVAVDLVRTFEHLKVAGHVADDEADADQPRHGHHDLLANLRLPEIANQLHRGVSVEQ